MDKKIIAWPGMVDHIVVDEVSYDRLDRKTDKRKEVKSKMLKAYIKKANAFVIGRPSVKALFQGRDDSLMELYKDIEPTTSETGETIISAKQIKDYIADKATSPEEKERMENEMLYWGSKNAFTPEGIGTTMGFIFDTLPISDGVEEWMQVKGKTPVLRANGERIIQTHLSVCTQVIYLGTEWAPANNANTLTEALRTEVTDQLVNWKRIKSQAQVEIPDEDEDDGESGEDSAN